MNKKLLIVAAHPDDEVLGCFGTVAKLIKQGYEAYTLILSGGKTSRGVINKQEIEQLREKKKKANSLIGIKKVFQENSIDMIVHLAARAGVRPSIEQPKAYAQTNIIGTINILELMKKYNIKKMCMASSSSVYGNCQADKFSEDLNLSKPISPYAATKLADELICYTYHHLYNLSIYLSIQ